MAEDRVLLPGSERDEPPGAAPSSTAADPNQRVQVTIILRPRATPPDPLAGGPTMTREEFAQKYGATPEDVAAVQRFATSYGLSIVEADLSRRSVVVSGTVAAVSAAFGTKLAQYQQDGAKFLGRSGSLSVPASLADIVRGVHGLDGRPQARAQVRRRTRRPHAASTSFTADQIGKLYGFPTDATGKGQTIGIIELGGGYAAADLNTYFKGIGLATPTVISVGVDGGTNTPAGNPDSADGEVLLDIEVAGSLAPAATIVVYFAPNTDQGFLDAITTAVHDATNRPSIISISWGGPESTWTQQSLTNFDQAFADAGTLGVTVTVAAGDNGSTDGVTDGKQHVDFPASSPHVVACGGTTLHGSGSTISSETVWNDGSGNGATGGGISDVFALPSYQTGAGVPVSANPGGRVGRGVPDVAGDADPDTGYAIVVDGQHEVFGGTSAVAPLWAGLTALLNERHGSSLGFLNTTLYANAAALRDITSGTNGAYSAGSGWDACTGLGSPNGTALEKLLAAASPDPPSSPPPKHAPKPPKSPKHGHDHPPAYDA